MTRFNAAISFESLYYYIALNAVKRFNKARSIIDKSLKVYESDSIEFDTLLHLFQSNIFLKSMEGNIVSELDTLRDSIDYFEPLQNKRYTAYLKNAAIAIIMSICCIESYFNNIALEKLNRKRYRQFCHLTLLKKYLSLQRDSNKVHIGKSIKLLTDLGILINARNKLIHTKFKAQNINTSVPEKILQHYSLTPEVVKKSVITVFEIITSISENLNIAPPRWIKINPGAHIYYFNENNILEDDNDMYFPN